MGELNNSGFPLHWRLVLVGLYTSYTMHPEFWKLFNMTSCMDLFQLVSAYRQEISESKTLTH